MEISNFFATNPLLVSMIGGSALSVRKIAWKIN